MAKDISLLKSKLLLAQASKETTQFRPEISRPTFTPLCNQLKAEYLINKLDSLPCIPEERTQAAIIIGESFLCSMIPTLSKYADLIISADIDPMVNAHNEFMFYTLQQQESMEDFRAIYTDTERNPIFKGYAPFPNHPTTLFQYNLGKILLDTAHFNMEHSDRFFLCSRERYLECHRAAKKLEFMRFSINLFDENKARQIKHAFTQANAKINFINVTNLHHYDANYPIRTMRDRSEEWKSNGALEKTLKILLNDESNVQIVFSVFNPQFSKTQFESVDRLEDYITACSHDTKRLQNDVPVFRILSRYLETTKDSLGKEMFSLPLFHRALRRAATFDTTGREVSLLIDYGKNNINLFDVNAIDDKKGRTALHWAVIYKKYNNIRLLFENGGSFLIADREGKTILDYALEISDSQLNTLLLTKVLEHFKVTDINVAFRRAAATGILGAVRFLHMFITDINIQDENPRNKKTALHWAALNKKKDVVCFLLENNADIDIEDANKSTPRRLMEGTDLSVLLTKNANYC